MEVYLTLSFTAAIDELPRSDAVKDSRSRQDSKDSRSRQDNKDSRSRQDNRDSSRSDDDSSNADERNRNKRDASSRGKYSSKTLTTFP